MRIIPTSVGKSRPYACESRYHPDHPHERGEKLACFELFLLTYGSSPRAWGKDESRSSSKVDVRIIPTSVGKSPCSGRPTCRQADHPHERGEKGMPSMTAKVSSGSSPRAWGKVQTTRHTLLEPRIIPTSVGKRQRADRVSGPRPDHPHERGEKDTDACEACFTIGSSPRAWGKVRPVSASPLDFRIIPTSVGKRAGSARWSRGTADHPHERGEKFGIKLTKGRKFGSSPRAWGKGQHFVSVTQNSPICSGLSIVKERELIIRQDAGHRSSDTKAARGVG